MSKQATESTLSKVNRLIGVDESYKAPEKIMEIISSKDLASKVFLNVVRMKIPERNSAGAKYLIT